ncbi:uncharacterized protein FIBRA_01479 [Fibroporia radiculosa]|uniref:DUF202 domain-containing protein n=1 Tax=Fibroporia radiculosa TaxID=599839 RepID=J4I8I3_9APHY|nr:uncharacterized protein FIBRA_01479 [Fibroporia radiculosa]CCL99461.1 predicted protein [Fibroporia radiculosa]
MNPPAVVVTSASRDSVPLPPSPVPTRVNDDPEYQRYKTYDGSLATSPHSREQDLGPEPNPSTEPIIEDCKRKKGALEALQRNLNPALTLENSGSVARDHLASERTFLAYVRTSLAIASTGVALVQLFTIAGSTNQALQKYSRPLGATIIAIGLCTLILGVVRYYTVQHSLVKGMYPVARISTVMVAAALCSIIVAIFAILVTNRGA